ncbi:hypothetical protein FJU11_08955 [Pararhizobium mangrovi]|uniref:Lipoprotein n=2 Tax=Pararhizobium mangrovi TaxID=2590452 RepID=A0A506U5J8_9HYPH|nr:hypothetical protein FJU11_08955 [Pararhizobium mangrovi]
MQSNTVRIAAALSVLTVVAGCSTFGGSAGTNTVASAGDTGGQAIVRGTCPKVELREGTSSYRTYKGGAKKGPDSAVVRQASIDQASRECRVNGNQVTMKVGAAGRVIAGPAGGSGPVTMPIRVAVIGDNGNVLYSKLTQYKTTVPTSSAKQFLFTHDVPLTLAETTSAQVFVGFDTGPYDTP